MDTSTVWDSTANRGDWVLDGASLETGNDVTTALLISLFTDRMADVDDIIPDGTSDPRGWWGDDVAAGAIGSRLWLLFREKQTKETLQRAYDYIVEAIQWMIDDKVVARFDINVSWISRGQMGAQVTAFKQDGAIVPNTFTWAWQGND
ncbi:phage GP46 family protein [Pandoraea pnomenusa]|uniref:phage GP46 family protein n=1 Tax=Pandoraea pnomenusa TaxID=93220 RepID=UPI001AC239D2|nr:phage GP46 family protein [Pandoraea pnomenusa]MBN9096088.1 phage GP46 family protein [Pandoraea pnomenusa]